MKIEAVTNCILSAVIILFVAMIAVICVGCSSPRKTAKTEYMDNVFNTDSMIVFLENLRYEKY